MFSGFFRLFNHVVVNIDEVHYFLALVNSGGLIGSKSDLAINDEVVIVDSSLDVLIGIKTGKCLPSIFGGG